ncbi:MAG: hypothetical protein ACPGWR_24675 [Ardenticatenaceae bacterium]
MLREEVEPVNSTTEKVLSDAPPSLEEIKKQISKQVDETIEWTLNQKTISFLEFEPALIKHIFLLGQLFISLFLCMREIHFRTENPCSGKNHKWQKRQSRKLGTFFGKVRYWRSYLYRPGGGYYPLDIELGLTRDGFSLYLQSLAAKIATKMSYGQSVVILTTFLQWSPSQKVIEETVLGLGKYTNEWFELAPAPVDDGEILIIQFDSKANPMARKAELEKRRGKRRINPHPGSQRHRGRNKREARGKKKRRKKGDKAKNGKMATIMVMYTLRHSYDGTLEGPINKRVYASHAPKRHVIAIARREANKRGFGPESNKTIQIVTDGDNDLARYIDIFFSEAIHTIDVYHATEYLWEAGHCLYSEGSDELVLWVEKQKKELYEGNVGEIISEIDRLIKLFPDNNKRKTLQKVRNYLYKRAEKMNYKALREQDLEISSGSVEGAVKHVIAKRFDWFHEMD